MKANNIIKCFFGLLLHLNSGFTKSVSIKENEIADSAAVKRTRSLVHHIVKRQSVTDDKPQATPSQAYFAGNSYFPFPQSSYESSDVSRSSSTPNEEDASRFQASSSSHVFQEKIRYASLTDPASTQAPTRLPSTTRSSRYRTQYNSQGGSTYRSGGQNLGYSSGSLPTYRSSYPQNNANYLYNSGGSNLPSYYSENQQPSLGGSRMYSQTGYSQHPYGQYSSYGSLYSASGSPSYSSIPSYNPNSFGSSNEISRNPYSQSYGGGYNGQSSSMGAARQHVGNSYSYGGATYPETSGGRSTSYSGSDIRIGSSSTRYSPSESGVQSTSGMRPSSQGYPFTSRTNSQSNQNLHSYYPYGSTNSYASGGNLYGTQSFASYSPNGRSSDSGYGNPYSYGSSSQQMSSSQQYPYRSDGSYYSASSSSSSFSPFGSIPSQTQYQSNEYGRSRQSNGNDYSGSVNYPYGDSNSLSGSYYGASNMISPYRESTGSSNSYYERSNDPSQSYGGSNYQGLSHGGSSSGSLYGSSYRGSNSLSGSFYEGSRSPSGSSYGDSSSLSRSSYGTSNSQGYREPSISSGSSFGDSRSQGNNNGGPSSSLASSYGEPRSSSELPYEASRSSSGQSYGGSSSSSYMSYADSNMPIGSAHRGLSMSQSTLIGSSHRESSSSPGLPMNSDVSSFSPSYGSSISTSDSSKSFSAEPQSSPYDGGSTTLSSSGASSQSGYGSSRLYLGNTQAELTPSESSHGSYGMQSQSNSPYPSAFGASYANADSSSVSGALSSSSSVTYHSPNTMSQQSYRNFKSPSEVSYGSSYRSSSAGSNNPSESIYSDAENSQVGMSFGSTQNEASRTAEVSPDRPSVNSEAYAGAISGSSRFRGGSSNVRLPYATSSGETSVGPNEDRDESYEAAPLYSYESSARVNSHGVISNQSSINAYEESETGQRKFPFTFAGRRNETTSDSGGQASHSNQYNQYQNSYNPYYVSNSRDGNVESRYRSNQPTSHSANPYGRLSSGSILSSTVTLSRNSQSNPETSHVSYASQYGTRHFSPIGAGYSDRGTPYEAYPSAVETQDDNSWRNVVSATNPGSKTVSNHSDTSADPRDRSDTQNAFSGYPNSHSVSTSNHYSSYEDEDSSNTQGSVATESHSTSEAETYSLPSRSRGRNSQIVSSSASISTANRNRDEESAAAESANSEEENQLYQAGYDGSTAGDYDYASEVETPSTVAQQRRQRVQAGETSHGTPQNVQSQTWQRNSGEIVNRHSSSSIPNFGGVPLYSGIAYYGGGRNGGTVVQRTNISYPNHQIGGRHQSSHLHPSRRPSEVQLPDIRIDKRRLIQYFNLDRKPLSALLCARGAGCLSSSANDRNHALSGSRKLLRFQTTVHNIGTAPFLPVKDKSQWLWHTCHNHSHSMDVFTHYDLLDQDGNKVAEGHKASFCLEDSSCRGRRKKVYDCDKGLQGISPGCEDTYKSSVDCQWIDVTDVPQDEYVFRVTVNPTRLVPESNYDNNGIECKVSIKRFEASIWRCKEIGV